MFEQIGGYTLAYSEMIEDENGLYRQGEIMAFCHELGRDAKSVGFFPTHEEGILAWAAWMTHQGYDVYALPATARTRDWNCGSLYSVTPTSGGESRVYTLTFGVFGGPSTHLFIFGK